MDVVDDAEGPLDPRIQIELENLNTATDNINKLEIELDEAHTALGQLWSESTRRLKDISNKLGANCIDRARCYYEALEVARQARIQCQNQAHAFHRAGEIHAAAKETVALAEARFMSHQHEWNFDQAWQDMLNHATIKVMDAENKKAECSREHHRRATLLHDADMKVQQLEEKYRRSIIKAEPYFTVRAQYDQMLATQKECVEQLEKAVKHAKSSYSSSFRALEDISNQIHQRRRDYDMVANGPREPGVGAELASPDDSLKYEAEMNKVSISRLNSLASSGETDADDRSKDFDDVRDLKERVDQLDGRSIDGSESVSNQWELELQASMEKLNNLSMKNSQWNSDENKKIDNDRGTAKTNNHRDDDQPCGDENNVKSLKNDRNESKKLPVEFQILKRSSSSNASTASSNDGRQSLTNSPINSIINRSKIAIRNSISKSLSNSPVNVNFSFGRTRNDDSSSMCENSTNERESIDGKSNSSEIVNFPDSRLNEDNNQAIADVSKNLPKSVESGDLKEQKINNERKRVQRIGGLTSHSVDSTPVRSKNRLSRTSGKSYDAGSAKFVNSTNFKNEVECKTSSVRELPLLSLFAGKSTISKDRSCSMINLAEKHNLKTLLENPNLRNIQAVSVERLASARNNIMVGHTEARNDDKK